MKGLYVHIPFCVKKCDYCDFVSFSGCECEFEKYIDMLIAELEKYRGEKINSIFIGGGTPSVLPQHLIRKLCKAIKETFIIDKNTEWTMEANPETLDSAKIEAMLCGGINRVSVGVQSFNDTELSAVGRIHSAKRAKDSVSELSVAGFKNINIDLMMSLPYQTAQSFKESLRVAVSLPITHISVYSLIIEEGTPIAEKYRSKEYRMPDEDLDRDLYQYTKEFLKDSGFFHYEISNYARESFESKHNLKYWDCDEYIGVGVSAHSYINGVRFYNTDDLKEYLSGKTRDGEERLTLKDMQGEFMMLGLRKTRGISEAEFLKRFGVGIDDCYGDILNKYEKLGLIKRAQGRVFFTARGFDVSNSILCELL